MQKYNCLITIHIICRHEPGPQQCQVGYPVVIGVTIATGGTPEPHNLTTACEVKDIVRYFSYLMFELI